MRVTDPINTALRWRGNLSNRRPYSVPGPNSLWHIGESCTVVMWLVFSYVTIGWLLVAIAFCIYVYHAHKKFLMDLNFLDEAINL